MAFEFADVATGCRFEPLFQPFICWSVAFEYSRSKRKRGFAFVSTLYLLECGFWIDINPEQADRLIEFQPFICWSVAFEFLYMFIECVVMSVSTLYLLECGFWMADRYNFGWCKTCFNPLFVGVWLLNAIDLADDATDHEFQPFICWSVAFELQVHPSVLLWKLRFNPLFVGVWLLNLERAVM